MRKPTLWNDNWTFTKAETETSVTLPHTWNAKDGQDGDNDYFRGTCLYHKEFACPELGQDEELWVEFLGVAMTATVTLNGQQLAVHEGGYSAFRVELTPYLQAENRLEVTGDNGSNR